MAIDLYRIDRSKETLIDPFSLNWSKLDPDDLPFWFCQQPGNKNALGQVKFNMPNPMSICMHDTNHPELFDQKIRALSSGCVRLERPKELANRLLLQKDQWDQNRVDTAFDSGRTYNIKLQSEIPVYLLYLTAWVDENE